MHSNPIDYDFVFLDHIHNISRYRISDFLEGFKNFYQKALEHKKYDLLDESSFNIFTSVSSTYHRENLHSDIIRLILDPETGKIGNPENIRLFVNLLKKIKPELNIELSGKITVECEKRRIDILVSDEKNNAIIIENKINYAVDQDDQLGRYYEAAQELGLSVKAIVYLALTPDKQPDRDISIKSHREDVEKLLILVSVIHTNMEVSFSDGFIGKCEEYAKNELARVYYSQYNELIKSLGGKSMAMEYYMPAIEEIYSNEEKLKKFKEFGDLWEKRGSVVVALIKEHLKKNGFSEYPNDAETIFHKIDDVVSLGFEGHSFGFVQSPESKGFSKERQTNLDQIIKSDKLKSIFHPYIPEPTGEWVYRDIDTDKIKNLHDVLDNFNILKKLLEKEN